MTKYGRPGLFTRFIVSLALIVVLAACAPSAYYQPASDFKQAMLASQDVYFAQLRAQKDSELDYYLSQRMAIKSWRAGASGLDKSTADDLAARKQQSVIDEDTLALRQRAFEAMSFYADTLMALASGQDTQQVLDEIDGFQSDLQQFLQQFQSAEQLAQFAGPFGIAVDAFKKIASAIGDLYRERALRRAIAEADPMIQSLCKTLVAELQLTNQNMFDNHQRNQALLNQLIERESFADRAARDQVYAKYADISARIQQINQLNLTTTSVELFESARAAHNDLLRQATALDMPGLSQRIKAFKQQAEQLKLRLATLQQ